MILHDFGGPVVGLYPLVAEKMANGGRKAPGFSIKLIVLRDVLEFTVGEVLGSGLPRPPAGSRPPFATEICNVWVQTQLLFHFADDGVVNKNNPNYTRCRA